MSSAYEATSIDSAFEVVAEMTVESQYHKDALQVFTGMHPTRGTIYVIIPPFGEALILPTNSRS